MRAGGVGVTVRRDAVVSETPEDYSEAPSARTWALSQKTETKQRGCSGRPQTAAAERATAHAQVPEGFWDYVKGAKIPVLGICYGTQEMVQALGGKVRTALR